ncbi:MAG: hypothetical protein Q4D78_02540 [Neisseria zoodegmatis]|uniref:hypothetical protein n=1 Tax=Neisseria zoodegmatis TaxID=326523 RepID=UPI0026F07370|nr:hypothetical protein [Neisseria zoodegmatis]MDO5069065.1 hypothetical protein [Neisseria zoodegmatis]
MAKLNTGKDNSLEIRLVAYHYVKDTETEEFYYDVIVWRGNQQEKPDSTLFSGIQGFDCEIDDISIADAILYALANRVEYEVSDWFNGGFDLRITPETACGEAEQVWTIKLSLGERYFGGLASDSSVDIEMATPYRLLEIFACELKNEEQLHKLNAEAV